MGNAPFSDKAIHHLSLSVGTESSVVQIQTSQQPTQNIPQTKASSSPVDSVCIVNHSGVGSQIKSLKKPNPYSFSPLLSWQAIASQTSKIQHITNQAITPIILSFLY